MDLDEKIEQIEDEMNTSVVFMKKTRRWKWTLSYKKHLLNDMQICVEMLRTHT